jgi:hypothetical protein
MMFRQYSARVVQAAADCTCLCMARALFYVVALRAELHSTVSVCGLVAHERRLLLTCSLCGATLLSVLLCEGLT